MRYLMIIFVLNLIIINASNAAGCNSPKSSDPECITGPPTQTEGSGELSMGSVNMIMDMSENRVVSYVGGGYMIVDGVPRLGSCIPSPNDDCIRGVFQVYQASEAFQTASQSSSSECELGGVCGPPDCENYLFTSSGTVCAGDPDGSPEMGPANIPNETWAALDKEFPGLKDQTKKAIDNLKDNGVDVDFAGGTVSGDGFGNGTSISSLGGKGGGPKSLSPALAKAMKKKIAHIKKVNKISSMGFANNGGGGAALKFDFEKDNYDPFKGMMDRFGKRKPSSVTAQGKSKMYGGQPIGVKMDNIFEMVHRNYQRKRRMNGFVRLKN